MLPAEATASVTQFGCNSLRHFLASRGLTDLRVSPWVVGHCELGRLLRLYGKLQFFRSDRGAEFTATRVMKWLRDKNVGPSFIPPGKPWHNGFVESFDGKLRDECLNREWFWDLRDARVVIESWREFYDHRRPHSALGYRPPSQMRQQELRIGVQLTA